MSFHLNLIAGRLNGQHIVDWIYMLEDETITDYLSRGALVVTTGARIVHDSSWLTKLVERLIGIQAAGLIVNTGMYIFQIPPDVVELCITNNFPLITMPWEIRITEMTQTLCMTIIDNQQESLLHDRAICTAILRPEAVSEYRDRLALYYDLTSDFTLIAVYAKNRQDPSEDQIFTPSREMSYRLERRIRSFRNANSPEMRICWLEYERYQLFLINRLEPGILDPLVDLIQDIYKEVASTHKVTIGVGSTEKSLSHLKDSYTNAVSAMKLAEHRGLSVLRHKDMGIYRILIACQDDPAPMKYANELLAPIDALGEKREEYLQLLDAYIRHDRSLEGTAQELFLHRNTVNYRLNKLRTLLNSPLKTIDDLIPYRLALSIRELKH